MTSNTSPQRRTEALDSSPLLKHWGFLSFDARVQRLHDWLSGTITATTSGTSVSESYTQDHPDHHH